DRKPTRFWNLTANTIVTLQMSPAGLGAWGRDQCENDRDHEVDHDERLRITDIAPGRYDVRFRDKHDRVCVVKNIEVKDAEVYSMEEKDLTGCGGWSAPPRLPLRIASNTASAATCSATSCTRKIDAPAAAAARATATVPIGAASVPRASPSGISAPK